MDPFAKLKTAFPRQYPRWRVCFENGRISYRLDPTSSLAFPDDPRVIQFKQFVDHHVAQHEHILDIGCGSLGLPGYLAFRNPRLIEGVDLIDYSESFSGTFHHAAAEFLPLPDKTIDHVVMGTSIDHFLNLNKAFSETHRVLKDGGYALIWSRHWSPWYRLKQWLYITWNHRYIELPPHNTVFYIPPFAPHPSHHKYLTLRTILRTARKNGFQLVNKIKIHSEDDASTNVGICLKKV